MRFGMRGSDWCDPGFTWLREFFVMHLELNGFIRFPCIILVWLNKGARSLVQSSKPLRGLEPILCFVCRLRILGKRESVGFILALSGKR